LSDRAFVGGSVTRMTVAAGEVGRAPVLGRSVVWECQISETVQAVPYTTDAVRILDFDDAALIRRYRSYYYKLDVMEKIASGMSGVYGWAARALIGYLVAQGKKVLDTSSA
jgi:hypothetical protein